MIQTVAMRFTFHSIFSLLLNFVAVSELCVCYLLLAIVFVLRDGRCFVFGQCFAKYKWVNYSSVRDV